MGDYGCERISKECGDIDDNPSLCPLISEKIKHNNVKYCAFIGTNCVEHYKTCGAYTGDVLSICRTIIPKNYLTSGVCGIEGRDYVTKQKECNIFYKDNYKYL